MRSTREELTRLRRIASGVTGADPHERGRAAMELHAAEMARAGTDRTRRDRRRRIANASRRRNRVV